MVFGGEVGMRLIGIGDFFNVDLRTEILQMASEAIVIKQHLTDWARKNFVRFGVASLSTMFLLVFF